MAQLTPTGLIKIMGLVTLIMVVPMMGGAVAGLVLDELMGTSPLLVLSGVVIGSLIAAIGIWLLIRAGARRGFTDGRPSDEA
jgi:NhaP-type Na+/H+ or K+/H+ antiporter